MVRPVSKTFAVLPLLASLGLIAGGGPAPAPSRASVPADSATGAAVARLAPEAYGLSRELRVVFALPGQRVHLPIEWAGARPAAARYAWTADPAMQGAAPGGAQQGPPLLGTSLAAAEARAAAADWSAVAVPLPRDEELVAPSTPGVYRLRIGAAEGPEITPELRLIVEVPFSRKVHGRLGGYFVGDYPTEGQRREDRYAPPAGFIRVTPAMQGLQLSRHFRLGEFLTHDQRNVWPKYVVLQPRLLDKLELVLGELDRRGIPARRMVVMSGYRTPQYNRRGLDRGRATLSRHQWGDAADVWVDDDGDGYMDDLNGDGRRDTRDARVILSAVEAVERAHPELRGGAGIYRDNGVHGPFIHIDARGKRARW